MSSRTFVLAILILGGNLILISKGFAAPAKGGAGKMPMQHHSGGGGNSNGKKHQADKKAEDETEHTTIAIVSATSITVQSGKGSRTYAINQETQIELKGSRTTVASLKPGMRVSVIPGIYPSLAGVIVAGDVPPEPPKVETGKGKS